MQHDLLEKTRRRWRAALVSARNPDTTDSLVAVARSYLNHRPLTDADLERVAYWVWMLQVRRAEARVYEAALRTLDSLVTA